MSCSKSPKTKYINRPGPPFPAQNCRNSIKIGNDRKRYVSVPDKKGIYKWKLVRSGYKGKRSHKKKSKSRKRSSSTKRKRKKSKPRRKSSHRKRDGMMNEESNVIYSWPSRSNCYVEDVEDFRRYTLTIIKNPGSDESVGTLVINHLKFGDTIGIETIDFKNKDYMESYIKNKTDGYGKHKALELLEESEESEEPEEKFVKPDKH